MIATGGGTGGHTYPAITTIHTVRNLLAEVGTDLEVLYVGSQHGLEARVAEREGLAFRHVSTGKLRRASNPLRMVSLENLRDVSRVAQGLIDARRVVAEFDPEVVLSTGGYVAVPVGLAARSVRAPLLVHEQTTRLGLANRILTRGASTVALSAPSSRALLPAGVRDRAVVTGNPVRPELFTGHAERAPHRLDWSGHQPNLPTVYVTGGAQGSVQVNTLIDANLVHVLARANVIHQCGPTSLPAQTRRAADLPAELAGRYQVREFVGPELPDVLALADVVVSRSGAGTLAELTALGKPSVLVPLVPTSGNEQVNNAIWLHRAGAARALLDPKPTAADLAHALTPLLDDPAVRAAVAERAARQGRPQAAHDLAIALVDLVPTTQSSRSRGRR